MTSNQKKSPIFREKSLKKLSSPDQIDKLMIVVTPKGWLALLSFFTLIAGAVVWSLVGVLPIEVMGKGIALTPGGVFDIVAPKSGVVTAFPAKVGDWISDKTPIASIESLPESNKKEVFTVKSFAQGQIIETYYSPGDWVKEGAVIAWAKHPLQPGESHQVIAFLPIGEGEKVLPGMDVEIAPETVNTALYGYLRGKVTQVSEFPVSDRSLAYRLRNADLAEFLKQGATAVIRVTIALIPNKTTQSGYEWTSKDGPPQFLEAGNICNVKIIIARRKPISYLLPILSNQKHKDSEQNPDVFPDLETK